MPDILIIDDTESNIKLMKSILKRQGISQITSFNDPLKALDHMTHNTFDLALIDYNMPPMNGIDLINAIRRMDHSRYQPLIMVTSTQDQDVLYDAFSAGASDFIRRPFDHTELLARIQNHLALWQNYKQLQDYSLGLEDTVHKISRKLRDSEEKYMLAIEESSDGIWDWNISERAIYFSPSWSRAIGFTESEIPPIIASWLNRVHPEDIDTLTTALDTFIHNGKNIMQCEYRLRHRNGHYLWMLSRGTIIRSKRGVATRMVGTQIDISQLKTIQEQLTQSAFHDSLTGLPNRALFMERLERAFVRYRRNPKQGFAVLFIDFDKYKQINDTYGHTFGDELLKEITPRLLSSCREMDTVARFGGDEFLILLNDIESLKNINRFITRLLKNISKPVVISDIEITTSVSIGVAVANHQYQSSEHILKDADIALFNAKKGGRSRCVFFEADLHVPISRILEIKSSLAQALKNDEIKMYYQPIVEIKTKKIVGLEALIRWQHPRLGLISPNDFLPIAEEDQIIVTLGNFATNTCLKQLATWSKKYPSTQDLFLSLNFTKRQIVQKDIFSKMTQYALRHGIDPNKITLEISEVNFSEIEAQHPKLLWRLKNEGFRIGLDDYGVRESFVATLIRFPFDLVKIDRALVLNIDKDEEYQKLFKLIGTVCRELRIPAVVEGIQTREIYDLVLQAQYNYGQGFYLSRPLPAEEIEELFQTNSLGLLKKAKRA